MSVINVVKGFFMGIALVVPGLAGSIFAIILGLYDKMLYAVANFTKDIVGNIKFLLPIAVGMGIGILVSTSAILHVSIEYPVQSYLFFAGLVIGSFPLVIRKARAIPFKPIYLIFMVVAFGVMTLMSEFGGATDEGHIALERLDSVQDAIVMMGVGIFAVSFMVIPGISGSVMLMIANHYGTIYNAVSRIAVLIRRFLEGNWDAMMYEMYSVILLVPFGIGAAAGVLTVSKLMLYILERYEPLVYYCVGGALASATITLIRIGFVNYQPADYSPAGNTSLALIGIVCLVLGALCTNFLDKPEGFKE